MKPLLPALCLLCACAGADESAQGPMSGTEMNAAGEAKDRAELARNLGLELRQYDLNRDGIPDVFKFFRFVPDPKNEGNQLEELARRDTDLNHDGKIDIVRIYDEKGLVSEDRADLDFDGRVDEVTLYKVGNIEKQQIDLDYDGRADVTRFFVEAKLVRVEMDKNTDGKVDTWEYYEAGRLDRIGSDTDLDGNVDHWEKKPAVVAKPEGGAT